jgi:hypothetical protein
MRLRHSIRLARLERFVRDEDHSFEIQAGSANRGFSDLQVEGQD